MKQINTFITEKLKIDKDISVPYDCEGGIRGTTQRLDVQLCGRLSEDVSRVMSTLLYTYEKYKSDYKGDFDSSKFKREYLYNEIEKFIKNNK